MTEDDKNPVEYITYNGVQGKAVEGVVTSDGGAIFDLKDMSDALSCNTCKSIGYEDCPNDPDKCVYCANPLYPELKSVYDSNSKLYDEIWAQRDQIAELEEQMRSLQHMERTALAWFQCQLDYAAHDGERMPYSDSYSKLIEDKIFNEHALKECLKARQALKETDSKHG